MTIINYTFIFKQKQLRYICIYVDVWGGVVVLGFKAGIESQNVD